MFKFIRESRISQCDNNIIKKLEEKYNVVFPEEFIEFHKIHDNDLFKTCYFEVGEYSYDIRKFYPLCREEGLCFEDVNDDIRTDKILPQSFFSFARDNGGNDFYWNSIDNKIYYISWDNIYSPRVVCNTMKEFFDILSE